jgi:hypothetical protein
MVVGGGAEGGGADCSAVTGGRRLDQPAFALGTQPDRNRTARPRTTCFPIRASSARIAVSLQGAGAERMPFTITDRDRLIKDPRGFMDGIACMVSGSCYKPEFKGHPDLLTFEDVTFGRAYRDVAIGRDYGSVEIPYLVLRKATSDDTVVFPAYLIEYEDGKTPTTVLGSAASLAFTANMNGCTLGIGSQSAPNGSLIVTHSNARGQPSQAANTAMQRQAANTEMQRRQASAVVGRKGKLFEPEHYRSEDKQAIAFGYRNGKGMWEFAYVSWRRVAKGNTDNQVPIVKSYGVKDIATNSVSL